MKKLIGIIFILLIALVASKNALSQFIDQGELMLVNNTGINGYAITVDVYPVGAIFNGVDQYAFKAVNAIPGYSPNIWGIYHKTLSNDLNQEWFVNGNFDGTQQYDGCKYSFGYGKYRMDFYSGTTKEFTCDIDFSDANFTGVSTANYYQQMRIDYYGASDVRFQYYGTGTSQVSVVNNGAIKIWEQLGTPNTAKVPNKGDFTDYSESASLFHNYPLDATQSGFFKHLNPESVGMNLNITHYEVSLNSEHPDIIFRNCIFSLADGKTLNVENELDVPLKLSILGPEGKFISGVNSLVNIPNKFYIMIEEGAKIESNGTNFISSTENNTNYFICLYSPGNSFIRNCSFLGIGNSIYSQDNGSNDIIIENNSFKKSTIGSIHILRTNNLLISNNNFDFESYTGGGILIDNGAWGEEENNNFPSEGSINIIGNYFHKGSFHIQIIGTVELSRIFIDRNTFYDSPPPDCIPIFLAFTIGTFSNNNIYSPYNYGISIVKSSLDLKTNYINSSLDNILDNTISYLNFAPTQTNNELIWTGGQNNLFSSSGGNIHSSLNSMTGFYYTNYGRNTFGINEYIDYHITGWFHDPGYVYYTYRNCWYLGEEACTPNISVWYYCGPSNNCFYNVQYDDGMPSDCVAWDEIITDRIISNKGYEIKDTILITQLNSIPPPSNETSLYGTGIKNLKLKNYNSTITNFKDLINTYPDSKYLGDCVYKLYECYTLSDTNRDQNFRNYIFGNLKSFLENKIQQYSNNLEFVNLAYDFVLRSEVKIKEYNVALDGYDFIANNSPNAEERLLASLCYLEVEDLIEGRSGGNKNIQKEKNENGENVNGIPIKEILSKNYSQLANMNRQREKTELDNSKNIEVTKTEMEKKKNFDKKLTEQANSNISNSSSLNKEEKRELKRKCYELLFSKETKIKSEVKPTNTPENYSLSQNYPNPFNPITKINFSLPKQGFVTLIIYDILGREIKTLINEIKRAGNYTVDFNGSEFSSGVYFYRLETNGFSDVKRMIMIK